MLRREEEGNEPSVYVVLKEAFLNYGLETLSGFLGTLTVCYVFVVSSDKKSYDLPLAVAMVFSCASFFFCAVYGRLETIFSFITAFAVTTTFLLPYNKETYSLGLGVAASLSLLSFAHWFKSIANEIKER